MLEKHCSFDENISATSAHCSGVGFTVIMDLGNGSEINGIEWRGLE